MEKTNLYNYVRKIYEIERFIYTQKSFMQYIDQKIDSVREWTPKEKYTVNPDDVPSILDDKRTVIRWLISILLFAFMGWVGIKIVDSGFHDNCLYWFENGFGDWWDNLNKIIKAILVFPFGIILLILSLIFWFRPVAAVVFGFPMGLILISIIFKIIDKIIYIIYMTKNKKKIKVKIDDVERDNASMRKQVDEKVGALKKESMLIKNEIDKAEYTLNKYYNMDIIYKKYRNLVAVSSFYEYFESGRCVTLTGHEGAYNTFESEIRQNLIIGQLSEVIKQLKNIEANQYMIYNAITETRETIEKLSTQIDRSFNTIETHLSSLNEISQITEYNTRITAQNTEFIKWISFFESIRQDL